MSRYVNGYMAFGLLLLAIVVIDMLDSQFTPTFAAILIVGLYFIYLGFKKKVIKK